MPALSLPSYFHANAASISDNSSDAAATFVSASSRADVYIGVRMTNPWSYSDLTTQLVFYPPPAIFPASGTISVVRGETGSLTIRVRQLTLFIYLFANLALT